MIAENIRTNDLAKAAEVYGFSLNLDAQGNKIKFTLRRGTNEKYRHISRSWSGDRRTSSVCLHGHYHFFKECFNLAPNAVFTSSWYGKIVHTANTLDANYEAMRKLEVGSEVYPVILDDCCDCGE